ncbi:MAG TPA: DUF2281 domain-containing protein [Bryobacteraceae bacterium]|jgi:hypothetical protein|nr:DUF2281 domain-containing protein [Bryobacteraceae bacterium]
MTIEEAILEKVRLLPPEKQHEVLDFTEFLQARTATNEPREPLRGLWKDLAVSVTEEDISEARREMWGDFPRESI